MNNRESIRHEDLRKMLSLAAAAALEAAAASAVEVHVAACAECRREYERLCLYARGLQGMPPPAVPPGLLQRTIARVIQQRDYEAEKRAQSVMLGLLGAFSCAIGVVFWLAVRIVVSGLGFVAWSAVSAVLAWATVAAAAVALRRRNGAVEMRGGIYE